VVIAYVEVLAASVRVPEPRTANETVPSVAVVTEIEFERLPNSAPDERVPVSATPETAFPNASLTVAVTTPFYQQLLIQTV